MENKFKNILKEIRKEKRWTQDEAAKIIGVSKSSISMWENGNRFPEYKILDKIADLVNYDIDYLLGRSDIKRKYDFMHEDNRLIKLNSEELSQLDKVLNETTLFFNAEDITDEDKVLLRRELIEAFFDVLSKNKKNKK